MMKKMKLWRCPLCGNLMAVLEDGGVTPECCGQPMEEVPVGTADASAEKHVPVITTEADRVTVRIGTLPHPMTAMHYIQWICLQTERSGYWRELTPSDAPVAEFHPEKGDRPLCAWAFCNQHGLWTGMADPDTKA